MYGGGVGGFATFDTLAVCWQFAGSCSAFSSYKHNNLPTHHLHTHPTTPTTPLPLYRPPLLPSTHLTRLRDPCPLESPPKCVVFIAVLPRLLYGELAQPVRRPFATLAEYVGKKPAVSSLAPSDPPQRQIPPHKQSNPLQHFASVNAQIPHHRTPPSHRNLYHRRRRRHRRHNPNNRVSISPPQPHARYQSSAYPMPHARVTIPSSRDSWLCARSRNLVLDLVRGLKLPKGAHWQRI